MYFINVQCNCVLYCPILGQGPTHLLPANRFCLACMEITIKRGSNSQAFHNSFLNVNLTTARQKLVGAG